MTGVLFFGYSILSCGTDYYLDLNLACPASWFTKNLPASFDGKIESIKPGTYVSYSVTKILKSATDYEPAEISSELFSYRLEDKETNKLFSSMNNGIFNFSKQGTGILTINGLSSSSAATFIDMAGIQTTTDSFDFPLNSNNGKIAVLTEELDLGSGEMGCPRDGLKISIINENGINLVSDKTFVWKDYDLQQLCPEVYYVSNDGKYFYVIGDSVGGGTVDTIMKYSVEEDKMFKADLLEKDSRLVSWQINTDNGWLGVVSVDKNLGTAQHVFRINLISGEITDLVIPHSFLSIDRVFLSSDGNFWSPVFNDGAEGIQDCVRVLSVGQELVEDNETQCLMSGKVVDWVDDLLIVKRDGELVLYDLTTKMTIILDRDICESWDPDYQIIDYIGTIKI
ncbi:MAG: hypothetical protein UX09_C0001G0054 [Candidatus Uhrbacteria bacterium GW2011_GWE2_45_35]|uniref:Uncharacterized protein n=1 Tax=Candidatus Uhrbacteria bacterium GW2011_GWE2_45_35 TaxID=1618993 RepID=A0A0G1QKS7_9BACT|nr:MAG: hypothetical protein UX09_C0001G0054 [Candidatus Uhrbacteria bacterium GW2011_GWE2_45_35]HBR80456.1 hypothetical protein [Candidatus Uhrbacteria bacterium]HCU31559.1 hypothetical protein [Candidatus Uhrbacteria bacterium]